MIGRIIAAGLLALSLAGCATLERIKQAVEVAASFTVTQNELDGARAAYDGSALPALKAYAVLPRCATGTTISITNRCHDRVLLKRLRNADRAVASALDKTQAQIDAGNTAGAAAAWQALQTAIAAAKQIIADNNLSIL